MWFTSITIRSDLCKYTYLRYILIVCIIYIYYITHGVIDTNTNTRVVSSVVVYNTYLCISKIIVILYSIGNYPTAAVYNCDGCNVSTNCVRDLTLLCIGIRRLYTRIYMYAHVYRYATWKSVLGMCQVCALSVVRRQLPI